MQVPADIDKGLSAAASGPEAVMICNTPMHILNALEAAREWGIAENHVWLIIKPVPDASLHGLEGTAELGSWGRVLWVDPIPVLQSGLGFFSSLMNQYRYHKRWQAPLKVFQGKMDKVFLPLNRIKSNIPLASWLRAQELVWLDDGTLSAIIVERRACPRGKKQRAQVDQNLSAWGATKELIKSIPFAVALYKSLRRAVKISLLKRVRIKCRRVMLRKLGMEKNVLPGVQSYFSVNEMWPKAPAKFRKNKSLWFLERLQAMQPEGTEMHFLGAPLVERDGVPEDQYLSWLRSIISAEEQIKFVYVLHPRESDAFGDKLSNTLNIETRRFQYPYEIEICHMADRPAVVASWFCSALDNLAPSAHELFKLKAFRLPQSSLEAEGRQSEIFDAATQFYGRHSHPSSPVIVSDIPACVEVLPWHSHD